MKRIICIIIAVLILCSNMVFAENTLNVNLVLNMGNTPGNIYFTNDIANWEAEFFNNTGNEMELSVNFRAVGRKYNEVWTFHDTENLLRYDSFKRTFSFNMKEDFSVYDVYDMTVTLSDGNSVKVFTYQFSYVKEGKRNDRFGMNTHYLHADYDMYSAEKTIPLLKKSGVSIIRDSQLWSSYEKDGKYAFDPIFTGLIDKLDANNIDLLFVLAYNHADYISGDGEKNILKMPADEMGINGFAKYAKSVAAHLKGDYFEIWNEPNASNNEGDRYPERYAALAEAAYFAIKSVNSNAVVIGPATTGAYNKYTGAWFKKTLDNGLGDYVDVVSAHPYAPQFYLPDGETMENYLPKYITDFKDCATEYGISRMWVTEDGLSSLNFTEDEQASYVLKAYSVNQLCGIEKYFWYDLVCDTVTFASDNVNSSFGVLHGKNESTPYAAKPVFLAMSAMNAKLADKSLIAYKNGDKVYQYKYADVNDTDSKGTYVIWSEEEKNISVAFNTNSVLKTDLFGNEEILTSKDGNYNIIVGLEPAYYEPLDFDMKKFQYSYDWDSGICSVKGYIDSRAQNVPVNMILYKPGKDENDMVSENPLSAVSYFDQAISELNGVYEFEFNPFAGEGIYLLKISAADDEQLIYKIRMKSELSCEVAPAKPLSEYQKGEAISADITINNPNTVYKEFDVYLVAFKDGKLTDVSKKSDTVGGEPAKKIEMMVSANDGVDCLKAFAWVKDSIKPLTNIAKTEADSK